MTLALVIALASAPTSADIGTALGRVNAYRTSISLPAMKLSDSLCKAASDHAKYLAMHNAFSHDQRPGQKGFTGADPLARARKCGFKGNEVLEDIAFGSPETSFSLLVNGPYHRRAFLQPNAGEIGIGVSGDNVVFLVAKNETDLVLYPTPGQRGVPTSWNGRDEPSPLRMHKGAKGPFGPAIQVFMPTPLEFTVQELSLSAKGGRVDCYLSTPANDDMIPDGVMLLPRKPLLANTSYKVVFKATNQGGQTFAKAWEFTTGK